MFSKLEAFTANQFKSRTRRFRQYCRSGLFRFSLSAVLSSTSVAQMWHECDRQMIPLQTTRCCYRFVVAGRTIGLLRPPLLGGHKGPVDCFGLRVKCLGKAASVLTDLRTPLRATLCNGSHHNAHFLVQFAPSGKRG